MTAYPHVPAKILPSTARLVTITNPATGRRVSYRGPDAQGRWRTSGWVLVKDPATINALNAAYEREVSS